MTRRFGGQWLGAPVEGLDDLAAVVFEVTEQLVPVTHPQPFQADVVLAGTTILPLVRWVVEFWGS